MRPEPERISCVGSLILHANFPDHGTEYTDGRSNTDGHVERYQTLYIVSPVWLVQLTGSFFWLKHFRFGPLEWLWRSLTYWKPQPMIVKAAEAPTAS